MRSEVFRLKNNTTLCFFYQESDPVVKGIEHKFKCWNNNGLNFNRVFIERRNNNYYLALYYYNPEDRDPESYYEDQEKYEFVFEYELEYVLSASFCDSDYYNYCIACRDGLVNFSH